METGLLSVETDEDIRLAVEHIGDMATEEPVALFIMPGSRVFMSPERRVGPLIESRQDELIGVYFSGAMPYKQFAKTLTEALLFAREWSQELTPCDQS